MNTSGKTPEARRRMKSAIFAILLLAVAVGIGAQSNGLRNLLRDSDVDSHWIYGDMEQGRTLARQTGKPLLLLFRCVP